MSAEALKASFQTFGFAVPHPVIGLVLGGLHWSFLKTILVTAIPFGIYDLVEAMDNVVSASAAGDEYPTTRVLTADGVISLIGCLMGNPYINAVYIGHPGWKAMGGRIGYSAATGMMVIVLSWFGVISLMTALIPVVAISPILLYIGMLIGSQAFQESPHRHAPAIVVALVPSLAAWAKLQIDNSLGAVSGIHHVTPDMIASMQQVGIFYHGLSILGGGSILAGVVLGAMTTFIIDRDFSKASGFAVAGAVLTFFGLMHGEEVGAFENAPVVIAYLVVASFLFACSRFAVAMALQPSPSSTSRHITAEEAVLEATRPEAATRPAFPGEPRSRPPRSTPSPARTQVKTNGRSPRILRASRSITSSDAPTCGARSVLLMTSRSERVIPGPPLRGILSPPATSMT